MNLRYVAGAVFALVVIAAGIRWYGRASSVAPESAPTHSAQPGASNPKAEEPPPALPADGSAPAWAEKGYATDGVKLDGDAGNCNDTCTNSEQIGETIAEMKVAEVPPTPQGGTLRSGTYAVTAITQYTGPGGEVGPTGLERSFTLRINTNNQGATFESAYVHLADKCQRYWQSGKMASWETWIKISIDCWTAHPAPQEIVAGFTATEEKLVVFNSPTNTVTFVRRP